MALQRFGQPLIVPDYGYSKTTVGAVSTNNIAANTEKVAYIGYAWWPGAGDTLSIHQLAVIIGSTQSLVATLKFSIQSVSTVAQAQPSGTILGAGNSAYASIGVTAGNPATVSQFLSGALTADYTVHRGDLIAIVVEATAYTSGSMLLLDKNNCDAPNMPYTARYTAAAWVAPTTANPCVKFQDAAGTTIGTLLNGTYFTTFTYESFASNSSPAIRGNKFLLPYPYEITGFMLDGDASATGHDFAISLYKATALQESVSVVAYQTGKLTGTKCFTGSFATRYLAAANEAWYLAMAPTTTGTCDLGLWTVPAAADLALQPGGTAVCHSTFAAGAWTDAPTQVSTIALLISAVDDAAQAGGGGSGGGLVLCGGAVARAGNM